MIFFGIFRKQKLDRINSPVRIVWKKVVRNKSALTGVLIIVTSILVAIFAYVVSPDKTPNANEQYLELAARKPGFKVKMLKVRKNSKASEQGFFKSTFFGKKESYKFIPINSFKFDGNEVLVELFNDEDVKNVNEQKFHLADVVGAVSIITENESDNEISYINVNGEEIRLSISETKIIIENEYLVEKIFLLGSDRFGRDLLSRLLIGARISLAVGFISVFISLIIGLSLGIVAGYYRGAVDNVILWVINVVWSIPTLLLVIAISMALGKGFWQVFIAVGMTMWVEVARVTRGQVISVRNKEYVEAGIALGYSNFRILTKHILPNIMSPVIVISTANFASAILVEAGLSFLGIGVQPPVPSWGGMIKDHYAYIIVDQAYLAIIPGVAIMLLVLAFTMAGNGLRDALDKKM